MSKQDQINFKRRDFLKNTTLGAAGISFGGGIVGSVVSAPAQATESKTVMTAAHWGPIGVVVEDGKAVKSGAAMPMTIENELQNVVPDQLYSEARVKYATPTPR